MHLKQYAVRVRDQPIPVISHLTRPNFHVGDVIAESNYHKRLHMILYILDVYMGISNSEYPSSRKCDRLYDSLDF